MNRNIIIIVIIIIGFISVGYLFLQKQGIDSVSSPKIELHSLIFDGKEIDVSYQSMSIQHSNGLPFEYREGQTIELTTQYPPHIGQYGLESILETNVNEDTIHINSFNLGTYDKFLDVQSPTIVFVRGEVSSRPLEGFEGYRIASINVLYWERIDPQIVLKIERAKEKIREFVGINQNAISKGMIRGHDTPRNFPFSEFLSSEVSLMAIDLKNEVAVFSLGYSRDTGNYHDGGVDTQEAAIQVLYNLSLEKVQKAYIDYRLGFFFIGE